MKPRLEWVNNPGPSNVRLSGSKRIPASVPRPRPATPPVERFETLEALIAHRWRTEPTLRAVFQSERTALAYFRRERDDAARAEALKQRPSTREHNTW